MYRLNLDPDGYLLSISIDAGGVEEGAPALDTLEGLDLSGERIGAYRWDGTRLVLDEDKLDAITAAAQAAASRAAAALESEQLRAQLSTTDGDVLEALEGLFAATTAAGLLAALIKAAGAIKDVLAQREEWRQRLREITGKED